jgi:aldehyde dehydrogenase (NAD+)
MCDFAHGLSRQLGGLSIQSERVQHDMREQYHPLGIVGIFSAFNFPAAVLGWNRCLSAICGNVDIWKPSSLTPFVSIAVQKLCNKVAADHGHPGIFNLMIGQGATVGKMMLEDRNVPLISFTGSTETGRIVARTVAERFGKTILELGGNNAIIVAPDADLSKAVRGITFGAVGTAGQRCTTTRRVIVHDSVVGDLLRRLAYAFAQVRIGDPLEKETLMGPLVTSEAARSMYGAVDQALTEGGQIIYGSALYGHNNEDVDNARFVGPYIIRMPGQTSIVKTETFAPILYVMTYKDGVEEAIAMQNDVPQGLSSAIFTESLKTAMKFVSATGSDCGIANVNCAPSGAEIGGAFGGEKETGGGREAGSDSWKQYMRRQTNTVNWGDTLPLAQGITFDVEEKSGPTFNRLFNERVIKSVCPKTD